MNRRRMLPEFKEWELARAWIRKHCRIRWFRRNYQTTVGLDGEWGMLEVYPNGDCSFVHGSKRMACTTSITHGFDYYAPLSIDDGKGILDSWCRKDGFVAPGNSRHEHIDKRMFAENVAIRPLVKFSENWWRFRHMIELDIECGPHVDDLLRCGAKEEDFVGGLGLIDRY